jgi:hypothetical protein
MRLPMNVTDPVAFVHAGRIHVLPAPGVQGVVADPANGTVAPFPLKLPEGLDYSHAQAVQAPGAVYLVGVSGPLDSQTGDPPDNRSRIVRIDPGAATAKVLPEGLDRLAWRAAAAWDQDRLLIVGGAAGVRYGTWTASDQVTVHRPVT